MIYKKAVFLLRKITAGVFIFGLVFAFSFQNFYFRAHAASGVPTIISYQGRLTDSSGNLLGGSGITYYFKFSIWDASSGGNQLWPSSAPSETSATVRQGVFNVNIGDTDGGYPDQLTYNFNTNNLVYLEVKVSSSSGGAFQTLTPRQLIAASAFAQLASAVSGTSTPSSFGTTSPFTADTHVSIEASTTASIPLSIRAAIGQAVNLFQIQESNDGENRVIVDSKFRFGVGTSTIGGDLGAFGFAVEGAAIIGNFLTASYITATSTTATSTFAGGVELAQESGTVGIGTSTPTSQFAVSGNSYFSGGLTLGTSDTDATTTPGHLRATLLHSDTQLVLAGLLNCDTLDTDANGVLKCGSDETAVGGAGDLQDAYKASNDAGQITTTDSKDLIFFSDNTATDANIVAALHSSGGGQFQIANTTGSATTTVLVITRDGSLGLGTTSPGAALAIDNATTSIFAGDVIVDTSLKTGTLIATSTLAVRGTGTSTFSGGLDVTTTGGLSSGAGLTLSGGDLLLTSGKITQVSTATSTIPYLSGTILNTSQLVLSGKLSSSNAGTSTFDGGLNAAALYVSAGGLRVDAGDALFDQKISVGAGTSTFAGDVKASLLQADNAFVAPLLVSCTAVETDAAGVFHCGADDTAAGAVNDLQTTYDLSTVDAMLQTTDAKDVIFDIEDTTTDANVVVTIENTSGGKFLVQSRNSSGAATTTVFSVNRDGRVGVGIATATTSPAAGLTVATTTLITRGGLYVEGTTTAASFIATSTLGVGTTTPMDEVQFAVNGSAYITGGLTIGASAQTTGISANHNGTSTTLTVAGKLRLLNVYSMANTGHAGLDLCWSSSVDDKVVFTSQASSDCGPTADISEQMVVPDDAEEGDAVSVIPPVEGQVVDYWNTFATKKSDKPYDPKAIGVIAVRSKSKILGGDLENNPTNLRQEPVSLAGRTPAKVSMENGPIHFGDRLTTASTPGRLMKATKSGWILGIALEELTTTATGKVLMFLDPSYWKPDGQQDNVITLYDETATGELQDAQNMASGTPVTFLVNQKGSGDLLQLQENSDNRLLIRNDGSFELNARVEGDVKDLIVIKADDAEIYKINSKGDVAIKGVIRVLNRSFAGSVVTQNNGLAQIDFEYPVGTGKPSVQLTVEGSGFALAQIAEFIKDENGNYAGFVIKSAKLPSGEPAAGIAVHYAVFAKEESYVTGVSGPITISVENEGIDWPTLQVVDSPNSQPPPNINDSPDGDTMPPTVTILGLNPTEIEVGATYSDPGVAVTDDVNDNLGYKVSLDGGSEIYPGDLVLDTSAPTEYAITYVAVDQAGNRTEATRTVKVAEASPSPGGETSPTLEVNPPMEPVLEPSTEPAPEPDPASEPTPEPPATP